MKTYDGIIAMLLAGVLFLSCVPAHAMTTTEKENNYNAAILQLETYLESAGNSSAELAGVRAAFDALGGYEQSRFLSYYTSVLMKIADEEYDYELYMFLDMLERNQSFNAYLKETLKGSSIGSVEELKSYTHGRVYEHDGANSEAIACYGECLNYFDASARYFLLQQDKDQSVYDEAAAMLNRGDLAGAYFKFSENLRYKDSKERRDSIANLLGYAPSSPTDNLEAVTGLKAAETKETKITISWQKSRHASSYTVYYKQHSNNEWISAGTVSETKKTITGLKAETAYDFQVIAVSGQVKTKEALLQSVETVSTASTPLPTPSPKSTANPASEFEYTNINGQISITKYVGSSTNVFIPETIESCMVVSIAAHSFYGCRNVKSIVIPNTVTTIKRRAFEDCSNLTSIVISDSVTTIGEGTFLGCISLENITLSNNVKILGNNAFMNCSKLASIILPNSIQRIGTGAFCGCRSLLSINIPNGCTSISDKTFMNCSSLTSITIPESVVSIGDNAFSGCVSLSSIDLPKRVHTIGIEAFMDCNNLVSAILPSSIKEVEEKAFKNCTGLNYLLIQNSGTYLHPDTFANCKNLIIEVPKGSYVEGLCQLYEFKYSTK